ncbi:MAG: ATP-binding protein [Vicinamibacterales bacterium]|nr:ATP-binding protein [Vicinamibacterales bacterium]
MGDHPPGTDRNSPSIAYPSVVFQHIFESAPDSYLILSPDLIIVAVTDAYLRATMTSRDAIVGRHLFEVFPDNPDDPDATGVGNLRASLDRVRTTLRPDVMALQRYDVRRPAEHGGGFEARYWLPANHPILDERGALCNILHHAQDVTETELGHQRDEARLQHVLELAPVGMIVMNADGRMAFANLAVQHLFGHDAAALVGQFTSVLIPDAGRGAYAARLQAVRAAAPNEPVCWDASGIRRDGSVVPVEFRLVAFDADTVLLSVLDLSPRVAAEEAARHAQRVAERASQSKNAFLARMSHELRTPLNAVLGFAQLLELEGGLTADNEEGVTQILRGGRHLLQLVNEVIDISRIESGQLALSSEPLSANEVAVEAVDLIRPLAAERQVTVTLIPLEPERVIRADRQRFRQVLLNLLANAVKYNRPGGQVRVDWSDGIDGRLRVNVHDTGMGIPAEQIALLFQPFERLGAEQTSVEGTGLGLTVTRALVEAMDGKVGVHSVVGQGSTFWADLRLTTYHQATDITEAPSAAAYTEKAPHGGVVLYVEDNMANVRLMERVLARRPGVRLLNASNGETGLRLLAEQSPRLVLLDLHLPGLSGEEVLERIRLHPAHQSIPVVILTADATPGLTRRLKAAGAHDLLTKPLDITAVLALIDRYTGQCAPCGTT